MSVTVAGSNSNSDSSGSSSATSGSSRVSERIYVVCIALLSGLRCAAALCLVWLIDCACVSSSSQCGACVEHAVSAVVAARCGCSFFFM